MVHHFHHRKTMVKKVLLMKGIFVLLGIGALVFHFYQDEIKYMKEYSVKSYYLLLKEKIKDSFQNSEIISEVSGGEATSRTDAKSIPVLVYHEITSNSDEYSTLLNVFMEQMFALKKAGYQTVTLEEFYQFMRENKTLPDKSFLLTFDDGIRNSYYYANPILKAVGYTAVMFVITKFSFKEETVYYLSEKELRRMANSDRWELQAHTTNGHELYEINERGNLGHYYSNKLWLKDAQRLETDEEFRVRVANDVQKTKKEIEEKLNVEVYAFAYPFGDYGQNSINYQEAAEVVPYEVASIYDLTFFQVGAGGGNSFNYRDENAYEIKRIEVRYDWTPENLLAVLETGSHKELPFEDDFTTDKGWIKVFGEITATREGLLISTEMGKNSAGVFLDGAQAWKDYAFRLNAEQIKGDYISLLAYYNNEQNYIECNFQKKRTKIQIMENGKKREIKSNEEEKEASAREKNVAIKIRNGNIVCYRGETEVVSAIVNNIKEKSGAVGIKVWGKEPNNVELIVKKVRVE